jgi:hypothetical protein
MHVLSYRAPAGLSHPLRTIWHMTIELVVDETTMSAFIRSQDVRISPHTGRSLAVLEVQSRFLGVAADREELSRSLRERTAKVRSADGRRFTVGSSSVMYTDESPVTTLTINLEEVEDLLATAVRIGDQVTLTPKRYREECREGAVCIEMIARTSGDATAALEAAIEQRGDARYLPVVREGVQAEPLTMRFGKCVWQQEDDGSRLNFLVLVEQSYDDDEERSKFVGINEPELTRALEAIASLQVTVDALLQTTVDAGLMPVADADALGAQARSVSRPRLRQFDRTDRIEDFWTEN